MRLQVLYEGTRDFALLTIDSLPEVSSPHDGREWLVSISRVQGNAMTDFKPLGPL